jgi:uncharacterized membrane protein
MTSFAAYLRARLPLGLTLVALLLWCAALVMFRVGHTGLITYRFLLWNLALAGVPWGVSTVLYWAEARHWPFLLLLPLLGTWLVFFPNAPYMLTDLLHLSPKPGVPLWYDLALLLSCAGTALALGYLSLLDVHAVLTRRLGWATGWIVVLGCLLLCGLGIYLGRYLRWNSWDVLTRPEHLLAELLHRVTHPSQHPRTWGVTALFGGFLTLGYALLRAVSLEKLRREPRD